MCRNDELSGNTVLDDFCTDNTLRLENILITLFDVLAVFLLSVVFPYGTYRSVFGIPILRLTANACGHDGILSVNGDTAHDSGRAVCLDSIAVDIK